MTPQTLADWLAAIEAMHPQDIVLGLDRSRVVADRLGLGTHLGLEVPIITVGGTNGKGSTVSMLESILRAAGYRTGLYIKPHFLRFNERALIDGAEASDAALIAQFEAVEAARATEPAVPLTYYEFTTLAILRLFATTKLDVVILEVGLGGRLDTVNLIDADCAVVTGIALDHQDYLGPDRESIGWEKAGIFRAGKPAICADPDPPRSLVEHAAAIGADLWRIGTDFNYSGDRQQWNWAGRGARRSSLPYPALRGANQLLNASGALAALAALADRLPVPQQAVRTGLLTVELPGRFQVLPGQPTVVLDVAHNPQAASALAHSLDGMGFHPTTIAIFGAMRDKDLAGVVGPLAGRVDRWFVTGLPLPRAAVPDDLAAVASAAEATRKDGERAEVRAFATPRDAWHAALETADPDDRIVVFGSFFTVAGVMAARDEPVPAVVPAVPAVPAVPSAVPAGAVQSSSGS
jgi:dihydrofolate synthase / folylpolyglutamate synthase